MLKKRLLAGLLAVLIMVPLVPGVSANEITDYDAAWALYDLGLMKGTGSDPNGNPIFELERTPTRHEAITMLVRLLGKDAEAQQQGWSTPFWDVAEWAKPYVGYAYNNGLTNGTGTDTYGGDMLTSAAQYITFVLRALGYTSGVDFEWNEPWLLSDSLGITNGQYSSTTYFDRGDAAVISYNALFQTVYGTEMTLIEKIQSGAEYEVNTEAESNIPDYSEVMGENVLSEFQLSTGNAYIVNKTIFGYHKSPYIQALEQNGFTVASYYCPIEGNTFSSEEYYNATTNERVFFYYETVGGAIIVIISVGTNLTKDDIDYAKEIVQADETAWKEPSPVQITDLRASMNSVGGWTFTFSVENNGDKAIKYVTPYWYCLNSVGDKIYDTISFSDRFSVRVTGPIEPGETIEDLENVRPFYNYDTIENISIIEIVIDYMDGSMEIVSPNTHYDYFE